MDRIREFDPTDLGEREWMALADHADNEVYVWTKMSEVESNSEQAKAEHQRMAAYFREKARLYREFAAIESQAQDEYEERKRSYQGLKSER